MPERSQPGNNYPHFSVHRLRQRAAQGLGEQGSDQAEVDRLFVTSPEGGRPDPHIIDADDVTRGLGLDHDLSLRISQVVRDTRADYSTKSAQQRIIAARGRLIAVMRAMVPHVPSDARQEVMRRAISYWKAQAPIDLGRTPQMRFGVSKSEAGDLVKAKYRKRVATGNPKRPWRYIYDEGQSPAKAKESADVEKLTKLIGRIRPALAALRAKDIPTSAPFHALAGTITAGMTLADRLYKHLTGRSIPKQKVAPAGPEKPPSDKKRGEDKKPRKKAERKKVGMLARALLKAYRELAALLEEAHEGAKVVEAREATTKVHTQEALLAAGGKLWEAHGKRRVYFNSGVTGVQRVKVWFDLVKLSWGTRGADKQGLDKDKIIASMEERMKGAGKAPTLQTPEVKILKPQTPKPQTPKPQTKVEANPAPEGVIAAQVRKEREEAAATALRAAEEERASAYRAKTAARHKEQRKRAADKATQEARREKKTGSDLSALVEASADIKSPLLPEEMVEKMGGTWFVTHHADGQKTKIAGLDFSTKKDALDQAQKEVTVWHAKNGFPLPYSLRSQLETFEGFGGVGGATKPAPGLQELREESTEKLFSNRMRHTSFKRGGAITVNGSKYRIDRVALALGGRFLTLTPKVGSGSRKTLQRELRVHEDGTTTIRHRVGSSPERVTSLTGGELRSRPVDYHTPEGKKQRVAEAGAAKAEEKRLKARVKTPEGRRDIAMGLLGSELLQLDKGNWQVVPLKLPKSGKRQDLEMQDAGLSNAKISQLVEAGVMFTRPTREERKAAAAARPAWQVSQRMYQAARDVPHPAIGEISGVQRARMGGAATRRYDADRHARSDAARKVAQEWKAKVLSAYRAGEIDRNTPGLDREAQNILVHEDIAKDKEELAAKVRQARRGMAINGKADLQIGEVVHHEIYGAMRIVKLNAKSARADFIGSDPDTMKVDYRMLSKMDHTIRVKEDRSLTSDGKWKVFQERVAKWEEFKRKHSLIKKSLVAAIPLSKAMNAGWGTGPSGSGGPGSRTDSLPDFSIYLSPEYQGRREQELLAAENRRDAERDRARRMWGPREQEGGSPELRYERQGWEARYAERTKPMLGIRMPTARGAKVKR